MQRKFIVVIVAALFLMVALDTEAGKRRKAMCTSEIAETPALYQFAVGCENFTKNQTYSFGGFECGADEVINYQFHVLVKFRAPDGQNWYIKAIDSDTGTDDPAFRSIFANADISLFVSGLTLTDGGAGETWDTLEIGGFDPGFRGSVFVNGNCQK